MWPSVEGLICSRDKFVIYKSTKVNYGRFQEIKKNRSISEFYKRVKAQIKCKLRHKNSCICGCVVHVDGKSDTGGTDTLGKGSFARRHKVVTSTKQKIVTKSSSEAELVGISDRLSPLTENIFWNIKSIKLDLLNWPRTIDLLSSWLKNVNL